MFVEIAENKRGRESWRQRSGALQESGKRCIIYDGIVNIGLNQMKSEGESCRTVREAARVEQAPKEQGRVCAMPQPPETLRQKHLGWMILWRESLAFG